MYRSPSDRYSTYSDEYNAQYSDAAFRNSHSFNKLRNGRSYPSDPTYNMVVQYPWYNPYSYLPSWYNRNRPIQDVGYSDRNDGRKRKDLDDMYLDTRNKGSSKGRRVVFGIVAALIALLIIGLILGIALGLTAGSEDEPRTDLTVSYTVTDLTFVAALANQSSENYQALRKRVVDALRDLCRCEPTNILFLNGSVIVTVVIRLPNSISEIEFRERLQDAANENQLLPQNTVERVSIGTQTVYTRTTTTTTTTRPATSEHPTTTERTTTITTTITTTTARTTTAATTTATTTTAATTTATTTTAATTTAATTTAATTTAATPTAATTTATTTTAATTTAATTTAATTTAATTTAATTTAATTTAATTTAATTTAEITEAPPVDVSNFTGTWRSWTAYTECNATCNGGKQTRERSCSVANTCLGVATQEAFCNEQPCVNRTVAAWDSWMQWGACSLTCGKGVRVRSRTCSINNVQCTGENSDIETCNSHPCPDCDKVCGSGGTLVNCSYCSCNVSRIGRTRERKTQALLSNVNISPLNKPSLILATSANDGTFTLDDVCDNSTELVFRKDGYLSVHHTASEIDESDILLPKLAALEVVLNPKDTVSLVGEDISLSCHITGVPPPTYYEWFRDGEFLARQNTEGVSTYNITDVGTSDSGRYTCRANNANSARRSAEALVTVKDSVDDFCLSWPLPHFKSLPSGCLYNNESKIDVGRCREGDCIGPSTNSDEATYCCGPTDYIKVTVPCSDSEPTFNVIQECGCTECLPVQTYVNGIVQNMAVEAIDDAAIRFRGEQVAATGPDGTFQFTIAEDLERITITVSAQSGGYVDKTTVINKAKSARGDFSVTVTLMKSDTTVSFQTRDGAQIDLMSNETTSLGTIDIPPNAFYTPDGKLYEGKLSLSLTTIDPADPDAMLNAPGDFSAVDEEGDGQMLESSGMFNLNAADDDGNALQSTEDIAIEIPAELIEDSDGVSSVKLWSMDPESGRWTFESDITRNGTVNGRRKRQTSNYVAILRGIPLQMTWKNLDRITRQVCFVKVRVFESDESTAVENALVGVIQTSGNVGGFGTSVSYLRAYSEQYGYAEHNGYCIVHPCKNDIKDGTQGMVEGIIFVTSPYHSTFTAKALDDYNWTPESLVNDLNVAVYNASVSTNLHLRVGNNSGPFYDWDYWVTSSSACSNAPRTHNSFDFFASGDSCFITNPDPTSPEILIEPNICKMERLAQLYNFADIVNQKVTSCYVKVGAYGYPDLIGFKAVSRVGDADTLVLPGDLYGFSEGCLFDSYVCLEVKAPGETSCSSSTTDDDDFTNITISVIDEDIEYSYSAYWFQYTGTRLIPGNNSVSFEFNECMIPYGRQYGIYCAEGATVAAARNAARGQCNHQWSYEAAVYFQNRWGPWSSASSCSVTCGWGERNISRECISTGSCVGQSSYSYSCDMGACVVPTSNRTTVSTVDDELEATATANPTDGDTNPNFSPQPNT